MAQKKFFDDVRKPLFHGRIKQSQVNGLNRMIAYAVDNNYTRFQTAYILATAHHETGGRMIPVREGFAKTDLGARRAVAKLYAKGLITRNYALPKRKGGPSYYGRGLVQITHDYNYDNFGRILKIPLLDNPDLALTWDVALPCLFIGHEKGVYRGHKLPRTGTFTPKLRGIINGDIRKNGALVAGYAKLYFNALEGEGLVTR